MRHLCHAIICAMNLKVIDTVKRHRKGIMGFSALWILFLHCWYPFMPDKYPFLQFAERFILGSGYTGVDFYIVEWLWARVFN